MKTTKDKIITEALEPMPQRYGGLRNALEQDMYYEDVWKALRVIRMNQETIFNYLKSLSKESED